MKKQEISKNQREFQLSLTEKVKKNLIEVRGYQALLDVDVAAIYGVETRIVNQAVRNNLKKFPKDYMFQLEKQEFIDLQSKFLTANVSPKSRTLPFVFTEKGLYMLATILKSHYATAATFAIIETFAEVRSLKRELVELHQEQDLQVQQEKMEHFGKTLSQKSSCQTLRQAKQNPLLN